MNAFSRMAFKKQIDNHKKTFFSDVTVLFCPSCNCQRFYSETPQDSFPVKAVSPRKGRKNYDEVNSMRSYPTFLS